MTLIINCATICKFQCNSHRQTALALTAANKGVKTSFRRLDRSSSEFDAILISVLTNYYCYLHTSLPAYLLNSTRYTTGLKKSFARCHNWKP